jgi:diaminopimelate epimerase
MRTMTPLDKHEYVRSHGLGNDYLVVDGARFGLSLSPERIVRICDRHTGVGSDGILELVPPPAGFDAAVRIYNPDGSEAEKSGNGVRIFAKFCLDRGYVSGTSVKIHTLGGPVEAHLVSRDRNRTVLRVSMGEVRFEWTEQKLPVGDREFTTTSLSVGNPHCVLLDAPFDEATARKYGPLVEHHAKFPKRTNVQLVRVRDRGTVEALIWERGAGWTLSSGSSSCAVAAACVRAGLTDRRVKVVMPGGTLDVIVGENWQLEQIGFAQEISAGKLSADLLADLD